MSYCQKIASETVYLIQIYLSICDLCLNFDLVFGINIYINFFPFFSEKNTTSNVFAYVEDKNSGFKCQNNKEDFSNNVYSLI